MNILITGGAGFIGTALYKQLKKTHNVKRIDIVPCDECIKMDLANMSDNDIQKVESILQNVDVVYHLASSVGVEAVTNNPEQTLKNSLNINQNMFPLFERTQCKVIYASSSEVYGDKNDMLHEYDNLSIVSPSKSMRGSYAAQKIVSEFLVKSYNFDYTIVRFFNIVGKGQKTKGMIIPTFIEKALKNEPLIIYGDGTQIRSYCDIRDAVNVLELLLTKMSGEIVNVGANNVTTTNDVAKTVVELTQSTSSIIHEAPRESEIQYRVPHLGKMYEIYTPKYSLKDIIRSTL